MAAVTDLNATQIVLPDPTPSRQTPPPRYVGTQPPWQPVPAFAPAWFYSALNWLGTSYYDANNAQRWFGSFLVGSDVDPYSALGSTRLFMIFRTDDVFRMTLATDVNSMAPMSGGTRYQNTDDGIRQMYLDLSASPIFAAVQRCYIPGQIASNVDVTYSAAGYMGGYDPATGLRAIVFGSAVSQIVPLDDFLQTKNEQIYNEQPAIVPMVSALVYDVTQYNTLGATTFVLPVYYARDQVSPGVEYVNKSDFNNDGQWIERSLRSDSRLPGWPRIQRCRRDRVDARDHCGCRVRRSRLHGLRLRHGAGGHDLDVQPSG